MQAPYHPFLLLCFFFTHLLASNTGQGLYVIDFLKPFLLSAALTGVFWILLGFLFKSARKAAAAVSALIFIFFSYGHLRNVMLTYVLQSNIPHKYFILMFLTGWAGICFLAFRIYPRTEEGRKTAMAATTRFLNIMSGILLLLPMSQLAAYSIYEMPRVALHGDPPVALHKTPDPVPDIYYIILDEYGRHDVLLKELNYDNSAFLSELRKMGFFVADRSNSNYLETTYSLSSMLNMRYLKYPDEDVMTLMRKSSLAKTLKRKGYKFIWVNSGCAITDYSPLADKVISFLGTNDVQLMLINTTFINAFTALLFSHSWRVRHFYNFEALGKIPVLPDAKFVFAHILLPHPPFVFRKDGSVYGGETIRTTPRSFNAERYHQAYPEQTEYLNKMVLPLVRKIISTSKNPPIIVLQADHGIDPVDHDVQEPAVAAKRAANLTAVLLPGDGQLKLYPEISPVNIPRVILDHYFDARLGLLEDRTFMAQSDERGEKRFWTDYTLNIRRNQETKSPA